MRRRGDKRFDEAAYDAMLNGIQREVDSGVSQSDAVKAAAEALVSSLRTTGPRLAPASASSPPARSFERRQQVGVVVAWKVVRDPRGEPSWENLSFTVPWTDLGVIFCLVYLVALATAFGPAPCASRAHPAEALRYE